MYKTMLSITTAAAILLIIVTTTTHSVRAINIDDSDTVDLAPIDEFALE